MLVLLQYHIIPRGILVGMQSAKAQCRLQHKLCKFQRIFTKYKNEIIFVAVTLKIMQFIVWNKEQQPPQQLHQQIEFESACRILELVSNKGGKSHM